MFFDIQRKCYFSKINDPIFIALWRGSYTINNKKWPSRPRLQDDILFMQFSITKWQSGNLISSIAYFFEVLNRRWIVGVKPRERPFLRKVVIWFKVEKIHFGSGHQNSKLLEIINFSKDAIPFNTFHWKFECKLSDPRRFFQTISCTC